MKDIDYNGNHLVPSNIYLEIKTVANEKKDTFYYSYVNIVPSVYHVLLSIKREDLNELRFHL